MIDNILYVLCLYHFSGTLPVISDTDHGVLESKGLKRNSFEYGGTRIEQESRELAFFAMSRIRVCVGFDMYLSNLQSRCSGASNRLLKAYYKDSCDEGVIESHK